MSNILNKKANPIQAHLLFLAYSLFTLYLMSGVTPSFLIGPGNPDELLLLEPP